MKKILFAAALLSLLSIAVSARPPEEPVIDQAPPAVVRAYATTGGFAAVPLVPYDEVELSVSSPSGYVFQGTFPSGATPIYDLTDEEGLYAGDGVYTWELRFFPRPDAATKERMKKSRQEGDERTARIIAQEMAARTPPVQFGTFRTLGGTIIVPDGTTDEPQSPPVDGEGDDDASRDILHLDDVIITFSLCVGLDCVNGENFGFDTIRLKENNLRIHFDDTSTTASFPSNDWRIVINDTSNGGGNYFAIEDTSGGRTPFRIDAGAPTNAMRIDSAGDLGLGTDAPVYETHMKDGDTPTTRLEQDGSSGFTPQTWDVAGNETNFFIRDATSGSVYPFRIRPGAPTSSIDIEGSTGDVGFGTSSPEAPIHVRRTPAVNGLDLLLLENNGDVGIVLEDTTLSGDTWSIAATTPDTEPGIAIGQNFDWVTPLVDPLFFLDGSGHLTLDGVLTQGSSREVKENLAALDGETILDRLNELTVFEWSYKAAPDRRHMGPMAEDFHALFGLGADEKHLAPSDVTGVALAAVKELSEQLKEKDRRIAELEARLERLEEVLLADQAQ